MPDIQISDNQVELIELSRKAKHKNAISKKLITIAVTVMIFLAISGSLAIYYFTLNAFLSEKEKEMSSVAALLAANIDAKIPGDYSLQNGDQTQNSGSLLLYKGETDITTMSGLISETSDLTGFDISLVYLDTRVLTTISDSNGLLVTGTGLSAQANSMLKSSQRGVFFKNTLINNIDYYSYYYPLYNSDDSFTGAIECCSPHTTIMPLIRKNLLILNLIILAATIILIIMIINITQGISKSISKLLLFTKDAASGNDAALLDTSLLRRKDEFGTIATAVLDMHRSLRDMMDKDALTKLYNRRSANRKLDMIISHYKTNGSPYSIAIGDIDFFKKVNDTYGHDGGDVVLQAVATILQTNMKKKGFVARWGGEEFLLAFDKTDLVTAEQCLEDILNEIRALIIDYEGREIRLTMSFGVACNPELSKDEIIYEADKRLYYSKENGRNQITSVLPEESIVIEAAEETIIEATEETVIAKPSAASSEEAIAPDLSE